MLDIEADFWRIVEENYQRVEVQYGADLYTSETGSGFPMNDGTEYASSRWNLNNIAHCDGQFPSLLRHVSCPMDTCPYPICPHVNIPGVMVPWLYVGMLFSSFCWHVEDHLFYSVNYCHWGEAKTWYAVPARGAEGFEACFKSVMPELFAAQPDLLLQLVTMLNPRTLQAHGVPVYRGIQVRAFAATRFPYR